MKTSIYVRDTPDDWQNYIGQPCLCAFASYGGEVLRRLALWSRNGAHNFYNFTSADILRELRLEMPRKKGSAKDGSGDSKRFSGGTGSGNRLVWLNIKLTDADIAELEQSEATFEFLTAAVCGLVCDGLNVSVKSIDDGKSYCLTIIRPNSDGTGDSYALSSFGGNIRDAFLVALYKLDTYLEGDFGNADQYATSTEQKQRFR